MKVKKVVTSILAMLVAGSVIAGCGGSGGDKKSAMVSLIEANSL